MSELNEIYTRIKRIEDRLSNEKQLISFEEACEYLGFSKYHLRRLCYRKLIPHYKPTGRTIFFFKPELDEWVRSSSLKKKKFKKNSKKRFQL